MAQIVNGDRLSGWLQCPAGDPVCRDPPAIGHHTGFIRRCSLPPMGATGERPEFDIEPPLRSPLQIFQRGFILKTFPQGDSPQYSGSSISEFSLSWLSCQRLSRPTCSSLSFVSRSAKWNRWFLHCFNLSNSYGYQFIRNSSDESHKSTSICKR